MCDGTFSCWSKSTRISQSQACSNCPLLVSGGGPPCPCSPSRTKGVFGTALSVLDGKALLAVPFVSIVAARHLSTWLCLHIYRPFARLTLQHVRMCLRVLGLSIVSGMDLHSATAGGFGMKDGSFCLFPFPTAPVLREWQPEHILLLPSAGLPGLPTIGILMVVPCSQKADSDLGLNCLLTPTTSACSSAAFACWVASFGVHFSPVVRDRNYLLEETIELCLLFILKFHLDVFHDVFHFTRYGFLCQIQSKKLLSRTHELLFPKSAQWENKCFIRLWHRLHAKKGI